MSLQESHNQVHCAYGHTITLLSVKCNKGVMSLYKWLVEPLDYVIHPQQFSMRELYTHIHKIRNDFTWSSETPKNLINYESIEQLLEDFAGHELWQNIPKNQVRSLVLERYNKIRQKYNEYQDEQKLRLMSIWSINTDLLSAQAQRRIEIVLQQILYEVSK